MNITTELSNTALDCARLFRLGRDVEGALNMVDLFSEAMPLFVTQAETIRHRWLELLMAMLKSQEARDSLGLADYLEYELIDLLACCAPR